MPIRRRKTVKLGRPRRVGRPKKVGGRRTRTRRVVRRGRGWFTDKIKSAWNWGKSKVSSLWNANKDKLKAQAMILANQAKDRALQYAREKQLLSSAVHTILPSKYGIDRIASGYVSNKTGMGRRRRTRRGRGMIDLKKGLSYMPAPWYRSGYKVAGTGRRHTTRTRRVVRRGRGWFTDKIKSAWNWGKSKVSSLWNANKDKLKAQAMILANQAKDKAIQYAREKQLLSRAVNKILPSKYGIDGIAAGYVSNKTGMGRRRRRTVRGRGFFGDLWGGVKDVGRTVAGVAMPVFKKAVMPIVTQVATKALMGGGRKRRTRRKTGRGLLGVLDNKPSMLRSLFPKIINVAKKIGSLDPTKYGGKRRKRRKRQTVKRGKGVVGSLLGSFLPW